MWLHFKIIKMNQEEILLEASSYHIRSEVIALGYAFKLIYPNMNMEQCYNKSLNYLLKLHGED